MVMETVGAELASTAPLPCGERVRVRGVRQWRVLQPLTRPFGPTPDQVWGRLSPHGRGEGSERCRYFQRVLEAVIQVQVEAALGRVSTVRPGIQWQRRFGPLGECEWR